MAVHGKRAKIWANGYDLTSFLRKAATPGECEVADASTFGMDSRAKVAGQKSGKITAEGLFASALVAPLDKIDDVLQNALGVEHVVWLYAPDSDAAGARCVGLQAITNTYEIDGEVADVVSVKVEAESNWVRPEVPPTEPRLTEMVCAARPVEAAHGMVRLKEPLAGAAPLTFFIEPSELNWTVPVPMGLALEMLPAGPE